MAVVRRSLVISCVALFGCSSPDQEAPFPYRSSTEADLTGDGVADALRLEASGPSPFDLVVSFSIWSEGREVYQASWDGGGYFNDPELDTPTDSSRYAWVRGHLDSFFDSSAFVVLPPSAVNAESPAGPTDPDNDPVELISGQLLMTLLTDSLTAAGVDSSSVVRSAREIAYRSGRVHPEAQGIWDRMTAEELLTFSFFAGGESTRRIAWSRVARRFFTVWACC